MEMTRLEEENERLKEVNRQLNADYNRSLERLKSNCRRIDELKVEVKELKAELNARLTCDFVKTAQKQAQIDILTKLKDGYGMFYLSVLGVKERMLSDVLNQIIEELKNDKQILV